LHTFKSCIHDYILVRKTKKIAELNGSVNIRLIQDIWEKAIEHKDWVQSIRYQQHIKEILEHENLEFVKAIAKPTKCCEVEVQSLDGSWKKL